jgi:AhpD family alkylhydroperoxidase
MKHNPLFKWLLALFGLLMVATAGGRRALRVSEANASENRTTAEARAARDDIAKTFGFVPGFFKAMADVAVVGAWQEMKGLQMNPKTALSGKTKELIGLAVASQVPCRYCIYAHTLFAELNGASEQEIGEAISLAGLERHWSAYLYGSQIDENKFRGDLQRILQNAKNPPAGSAQPILVVDARTAYADIQQSLGFVPDFFRAVPESALPGAWREMKDVKLAPTSIAPKYKALIELAVASQVPSRPCIIAETEFAKLGGATEAEISEAVGMAAITRNMSTMLNGLQIDEAAFRADIDRVVAGVKAAQRKSAALSTTH